MLTHKTLQDLILHHSLEQQTFSAVALLQVLNQVAERLDSIEALLEKRQQTEKQQMQEVKRAMLSKVTGQLNHLEKTHLATITDLATEVKAIKQSLENAKSKFIGFE
jgi:Ni,Fe-hydrogenase III component G